METTKLRRFSQYARHSLIEQTSAKLEFVLAEDSSARREFPKAVADLEKQVALSGREQVIEKVAYTWFNRFCALRFMDLNGYNRIRVVSPADESQFQPEILAEAKAGYIDDDMVKEPHRQHISSLLSGTTSSSDPQQEAYRLLIVSACNYWHKSMSFMFEKIEDYTELLIPSDLLSGNSILAYTREAMTPDVCKDVEVIGWLYQFYISEKKDQVFEALKKNKKVEPEDIPAATQLFTPHWIVRYLVENSLGRLWMLNHPNSNLIKQMDYYIKPEQPETDFLIIRKPEELKICDPACGSGHMLTYAFDLLYTIYDEFGTDPNEIPEKILTYNLFGIEIDQRAGELAAFALTMKARGKQRRFFNKSVKPNICVLQNIKFDQDDLSEYMSAIGTDLFTSNLRTLLTQFDESDNFGSLIRPVVMNYSEAHQLISDKGIGGQLLLEHIHEDVLRVLVQSEYLSKRYAVVVANPPYMGGKGMNGRLTNWLKENYADVKSDLFSAFMVRVTEMTVPLGQMGFMSPFVWMFISSYEKLRLFFINEKTIISLIQLEYSGFDGATVPICTFTLENAHRPNYKGGYVRLSDFKGSENQAPRALEAINNNACGWFYRASSKDFKKVPSSPIAYWIGDGLRNLYSSHPLADKVSQSVVGLQTGDNDRFMRFWYEVSLSQINSGFDSTDQTRLSNTKWVPYNKGGSYRKWYGNREYVVNWQDDGNEIRNFKDSKGTLRSRPQNTSFYFREAVTWSEITSSWKSFRYNPPGSISDVKGQSAYFSNRLYLFRTLAWLNSNVVEYLTKVLNPTLSFQSGDYRNIPIPLLNDKFEELSIKAVEIAKNDWDAYEISSDFQKNPLYICKTPISKNYSDYRSRCRRLFLELYEIEKYINEYLIKEFSLESDVRTEVQREQITLNCNPHFRFGGGKSEEELEALLLATTIREFISYAVGCMFGRYSLDQDGLILANQGQILQEYLVQVPNPSFMPDEDNVIPILDGDWFTDDITERFRLFLKVTFGEEKYEENLHFIEAALGKNGKILSIRDYFLKDFYNDHIKRYKKRPIYWMFSSPKGSFNALIYMHRYRPDTVSIVLNDYLREFRTKLNARKSHLEQVSISGNASASEKTKAIKDVESLKKVLVELEDYERDVMYPLATRQIEIDLDDGVKKNYGLFGSALKKIVGLDAQDD